MPNTLISGLTPDEQDALLNHLHPDTAPVDVDCELVCVVDRSGSMASVREDAIGGFNTFLEGQRAAPGTARLSLTLFNHVVDHPLTAVPLEAVAALTAQTYVPEGMTALYDAIGSALTSASTRLAASPAERRPRVVAAILTDGLENSSRHYSREAIAAMIEERRAQGWEFVFLAANQDAFVAAERLHIPQADAAAFVADAAGTQQAFRAMSARVASKRELFAELDRQERERRG